MNNKSDTNGRIAAVIVMPMGSGKTTLSKISSRFRDVDDATPSGSPIWTELKDLRAKALNSGDWRGYNSRRNPSALSWFKSVPNGSVVMVHSEPDARVLVGSDAEVLAYVPPVEVTVKRVTERESTKDDPAAPRIARHNWDGVNASLKAGTLTPVPYVADEKPEAVAARILRAVDAPSRAPNAMILAAGLWMVEEAEELVVAEDRPAQADAILDCMGILISALYLFSPSEIQAAYQAYRDAQTKRGRPLDMPHQKVITVMVGFMVNTTGAIAMCREMFAWRADVKAPNMAAAKAALIKAGIKKLVRTGADPASKGT